jgi:CDP-diacylglycerol pyrophosphatase
MTPRQASGSAIPAAPARRRLPAIPRLALAGGLAAMMFAAAGAEAGLLPRTALYAVVRACALAQDSVDRPFPCLSVSAADAPAPRTAVLRAPGHATHVILVPIARIPGIEDPRLRRAPFGQLWSAALAARRYVREGARASVPTAAVALAINADATRSQDQLHIHAECLRPALLAAIRDERATLGLTWRPLPRPVAGDRFVARLTSASELAAGNLFASLAQAPGLRDDLSGVSALVVAADARDDGAFIALATATRRRTVERLFDEDCRATLRLAPSAG